MWAASSLMMWTQLQQATMWSRYLHLPAIIHHTGQLALHQRLLLGLRLPRPPVATTLPYLHSAHRSLCGMWATASCPAGHPLWSDVGGSSLATHSGSGSCCGAAGVAGWVGWRRAPDARGWRDGACMCITLAAAGLEFSLL